MALPKRSKNFSRMISGSFVKRYEPVISERPDIRNCFIIEHTSGTAHRSTEPCEACRRLAATAVQPVRSTLR